MELIKYYTKDHIEGLTVFQINDILNNTHNMTNNGTLFLKGDKLILLKCVREYYLSPTTNKKIPKINISNDCYRIQRELNIENVTSKDCLSCHKNIINQYFNNKISISRK